MVICAINGSDRETVHLTPCRSLRIERDCALRLYEARSRTQSVAVGQYLSSGYSRLDISGPLRLARLRVEPSMDVAPEEHRRLWVEGGALCSDAGVIARLAEDGGWRDAATQDTYESFLVVYAGDLAPA